MSEAAGPGTGKALRCKGCGGQGLRKLVDAGQVGGWFSCAPCMGTGFDLAAVERIAALLPDASTARHRAESCADAATFMAGFGFVVTVDSLRRAARLLRALAGAAQNDTQL